MKDVLFNRARSLVALFAACLVVACGDSGGDPGKDTGNSSTIGASGGSVAAEGVSLQIPAGALTGEATITVTAIGNAPQGALSKLFAFGPDGTTFATPVTVSFPVPEGSSNAVIYWSKAGSTTEFEPLPTTVTGGSATASTTHFSRAYLGERAGGNSFSGNLPDGVFTVEDAFSGVGGTYGVCAVPEGQTTCEPTAIATSVIVFQADYTGFCAAMESQALKKNSGMLAINASVAGGADPQPGPYPIRSDDVFPNARVRFGRLDGTCGHALELTATSGTVTLTSVTPTVAGFYDVLWSNGERASGTFDAPECPGPFSEGEESCVD